MARIAMRTLVLVAALAITVGVDAQQRQPRPAPPPPVAPPHATPPPVTMPFPPLAAPPAGGLTPRVPFTTIPNPLTTRDLFRVRPNDRVYSRTNGFPLGGYGGYGAGAYVPGVPQIEPSDA